MTRSLLALAALILGAFGLVSTASPVAPPDTTLFTWQPPANNTDLSLCGDGITGFSGDKVNYTPSKVEVTITHTGGRTIDGNAACFSCSGFNGCTPTDLSTRWKASNLAIGAAVAVPGESLYIIPGQTCPTNLSTQAAQGHMVWYSEIDWVGDGEWFGVNANNVPSWDWHAGGPTGGANPVSGTFTITDPAILAEYKLSAGTPKKWEMEVSTGNRYLLEWTACIHQYFPGHWTDDLKVQVDIYQ